MWTIITTHILKKSLSKHMEQNLIDMQREVEKSTIIVWDQHPSVSGRRNRYSVEIQRTWKHYHQVDPADM